MATRPIVLSNGEMHVGLNTYGLVHDLYYPYVGLENHSADRSLRHRVGVFVDGQMHWLDDNTWVITQSYPHDSLIGHTVARNADIGIIIEFDDVVDVDENAFLRTVHVINEHPTKRAAKLYMHQAFIIGDSRSYTDTAQYLPDTHAVMHYRGRRVFLISGDCGGKPFDQYAVGLFGIEGHESTYRDAEDGQLSGSNVEHGQVDSTIGFELSLEPHSSTRVNYWIAAGTSTREALAVHKFIRHQGMPARMARAAEWWYEWTKPAAEYADKVDPKYREMFMNSVMIIKSHIDKRGAVIASSDSSLLKQMRDAYAYCWPRDGAYALWPLIRMGYTEEPLKFFDFCRRHMHPGGYLMHKYRADGALGSSWHPYEHPDGEVSPPIQEDETALTLFVFAQYYYDHDDRKLLHDYYQPMVLPMASFLANFVDERTHLPKPSYDLWEEVYLTTTYTTAVTYAALLAASELAEAVGDSDNAVAWRTAADDMATAARKLLWRPDKQTFYKGLLVNRDGAIEYSTAVDSSSMFGAFMYGLFAPNSDEIAGAVATMEQRLRPHEQIGFGRYEGDTYFRQSGSTSSNMWIICSLWVAQYYLERGRTDEAVMIIDWVQSRALSTGMLPEQITPEGNRTSVLPLVWSHAEFVATMLDSISEEDV